MVNPVFSFLIGFVLAIIIILIFNFSARVNQNASSFYKQTFCSSLS